MYKMLKYFKSSSYDTWYESFLYNLEIEIRCFFIGISNLVRWFPVIWRDRDFDYRYLLDMMDKKLEFMEKFFSDPDKCHIVDESRLEVLKEIKECREYYKKWQDFSYCYDLGYKNFNEKWGKPVHKFIKNDEDGNFFEWKTINAPNCEITREEYHQDFTNAREYHQLLENHFKEKFFNLMNKRIEYWWD